MITQRERERSKSHMSGEVVEADHHDEDHHTHGVFGGHKMNSVKFLLINNYLKSTCFIIHQK